MQQQNSGGGNISSSVTGNRNIATIQDLGLLIIQSSNKTNAVINEMKDQVKSTSDAVISVQQELANQKVALNDLDTKVETRLSRCSNDIGEIKQDLLTKERMINDLKAMVTGFQNRIPAQMEQAVDSKLSSFVQDSYEKLMIEKCKQSKARILFFNVPHTGGGLSTKLGMQLITCNFLDLLQSSWTT